MTGFVGLVYPILPNLELAANLGSGLRFPSLGERFFEGVTGAGRVIGNPGLDSERSRNLDLGLRLYGQRLYVGGFVYRNAIDDYIERIVLETDAPLPGEPDLLTFVNLTEGTIEGVELEGLFKPHEQWSLGFGGHLMQGRSEEDEPLADIPANRIYVVPGWSRGRWLAELRWEYRDEKDDPGPREKPIPSVNLVSASLQYRMDNGLALSLAGGNLLDELYFNAADSQAAPAPGRSVGLALQWQQPRRRVERGARRSTGSD